MIRLYLTDEQAKLLQDGLRLLTAKKESEYWDRGRKSEHITDEFMMIDALIEILDKELSIYKKALELSCKELEDHPYSCWNQTDWLNYFLQKAGEDHDNT